MLVRSQSGVPFDEVAQRLAFKSSWGCHFAVGAGWICTRLSTGTKRDRNPSAAPFFVPVF